MIFLYNKCKGGKQKMTKKLLQKFSVWLFRKAFNLQATKKACKIKE